VDRCHSFAGLSVNHQKKMFCPARIQIIRSGFHHFRSRECVLADERDIHRANLFFPQWEACESSRLTSSSCAEALGGMGLESDVEDGDVRMLKLQALFSYRKRSVSNGKQLLFIQQQVSFIRDRPFVFARHA
jgi:hypothetical protein